MFAETKLHPPRAKPNLLSRDRLFGLVHSNLDKRLMAVIAGAGYGKTTLLGQVLEREQLPAVFLSLDSKDSDPVRFIHCLLAGLMRLAGGQQRSTLDQSLQAGLRRLGEESSLMGDPSGFATAFINELAAHRTEQLFIVLDDYQCLDRGSLVHQILDCLIDLMPSSVHLIISSRTPLPLPSLPKWRSKQEVLELDQADLAFGQEDIRALIVNAYRAALSENDLTRMLEQTQGWIAGIHLIMQAAGMHKSVKETLNGYVAANRPLFEYFASEILGKEDEAVRDFLVQSSVLETLSGPACDYLLERKESDKLLKDLERRSVFLTESAPGQFRYHPLFRNFLRSLLADSERIRMLNNRAGRFCRRAGLAEPAIDHFLQSGDSDQAASLLIGIQDAYTSQARFDTLGRWFGQLPDQIYEKHPQLLLPLAWWHLEQQRPEEQRRAIDRAIVLLERAGDRHHLCRALLCRGDILLRDRRYEKALRTLERGLRLCPRSQPDMKSGLYYVLGQVWLRKGKHGKAADCYRKAIRMDRAAGISYQDQFDIQAAKCELDSCRGDYRASLKGYATLIGRIKPEYYELGIGMLYGSAARVALAAGEIEAARSFLVRGQEACRRRQDARSSAMLALVDARLDFFSSRWDGIEDKLDHIEKTWRELGEQEWVEAVWRSRVQFFRYQNKPEQARRWLGRFGERGWLGDQPSRQSNALYILAEKGYLEAAAGEMAAARRTAKTIAKTARKLGDRLGSYHALVLEALAAKDNLPLARRLFGRALAVCQRFGYHGVLALEIRNNPKLRDLYQAGKGDRRIDDLIASPAARPTEKAEGYPLTVRLFGQVEIVTPTGRPTPVSWRTRKAGALFAYLVINRKRLCNSEELVEALWPRAGVKQAKAQLYQTVCLVRENLRSGLSKAGLPKASSGELVLHQTQGYRLSPELEVELDVEHFDRLWREHIQFADAKDPLLADCCRQALELYRNGFLPAAGDPWSEGQREQYYKKYLMINEKLGRHLAAAGQPQSATVVFEEYLRQEPFAENVRLEYWKALLAVGNRKRMAADQQNYLRLLRRELGQPPGPELTAFLRSL